MGWDTAGTWDGIGWDGMRRVGAWCDWDGTWNRLLNWNGWVEWVEWMQRDGAGEDLVLGWRSAARLLGGKIPTRSREPLSGSFAV